jgi:hypothetical protein
LALETRYHGVNLRHCAAFAGKCRSAARLRLVRMRAKKGSFGSLRIALSLFAMAAFVAIGGCGDGKIARYQVSGTVMVDGKAAEGAQVVFCPAVSGPELENFRPAGFTDSTGKFTLTTIDSTDGAPAGQYKVLVKWQAQSASADDGRGGRGGPKGPDRLKGKYYNLDTTPLSATIEEKSNELPPFELSTK